GIEAFAQRSLANIGEQSQCSKGPWRRVASISEQNQRKFAQRTLARVGELRQSVLGSWRELASSGEEMLSKAVLCYVSENP
ncbi:hypothetical protein L195_g060075, partial [Trifolium pratense]